MQNIVFLILILLKFNTHYQDYTSLTDIGSEFLEFIPRPFTFIN